MKVSDVDLHYEKVGNGKVTVALLPGALGTARTDFSHQLDGLNKEKFTIIAWDPPGYGASRPPEREFNSFYRKDAALFTQFMKALGYEKYSLVGWSDGAVTGLIVAANNPNNVEKLVSHSGNAYYSQDDKRLLEATKDIRKWNARYRETFANIYGEELLQQMWSKIVDYWLKIDDICVGDLSKITCPTLIIQGEKDPLVSQVHPTFLASRIKNSRVHIFPGGKHNVHQKFAKEFNELVENFLLE